MVKAPAACAAVKNALKLGAHSVEHGYIMDDECIELFLKTGAWYVPTLAISHLTPEQVDNDWERAWVKQRNMPHAHCCRADAASDVHAAQEERHPCHAATVGDRGVPRVPLRTPARIATVAP